MKSLIIGIAVLLLVLIGFAIPYLGRSKPIDAIYRRLGSSIPRESIVFAKQIESGREPTFICVILTNGITHWPDVFRELGCNPYSEVIRHKEIEKLVSNSFKIYPPANTASSTNGFVAWGGARSGTPYYISALVSNSNAFVVLLRY